MRSVYARLVVLAALPACNQLLGISDPSAATDATGPNDNRPDDAMPDIFIPDAPPDCTTASAFGSPITSAVGGTGVALVVAKFDAGATQDVAISITTDTAILVGDSTGAFAASQLLGTASTDLTTEDFDNIGARKDLLLITGTSAVVRQQKETGGAGVFDAEQPLTGPFTNARLAPTSRIDPMSNNVFAPRSVGQFDLGFADVVISDDTGVIPFTSLGTAGTFSRETTIGAAGDRILFVGDIDRANDADFLFVDNAGNVKLVTSDGSGGFNSPSTVATGLVGGLAVGNFSDDNFLDLVVVQATGGTVFTQDSANPGTFTAGTSFAEVQGNPLLVGDINGDGLDDVMSPTAAVLQCPTTHAFTQRELIDAAAPAVMVDVTGNGKLDLLRLTGTDLIVRVQ